MGPTDGANGCSRQSCVAMHADMVQSAVLCLVFGDAAEAHMQLRVGTLVALRAPLWDNHGEGSLKVIDKGMVLAIGDASDFGHCAGTKRDGTKCSMIVNTAVCRMCDWHLKQTATKVRCLCSLSPTDRTVTITPALVVSLTMLSNSSTRTE